MQFRLYKVRHIYTDKDGNEKQGWNFYLGDNSGVTAIKPCFKEDYRLLVRLADELESSKEGE